MNRGSGKSRARAPGHAAGNAQGVVAGNALFLILIAVALFAALAYAVTQSGRGGSGGAGRETADLAVSQLLQHFAQAASVTQRLILSNTCTDSTVRFWHASRAGAADPNFYGDGSNTSCQLFDPAGGGMAYIQRPAALATTQSSEIMVLATPIVGLGASDAYNTGAELFMAANVPRDACVAINQRVGVTNPSGEPPAVSAPQTDWYKSPGDSYVTFPSSGSGYPAGGIKFGETVHAPEVARAPIACIKLTDSGSTVYYLFYSVLLER